MKKFIKLTIPQGHHVLVNPESIAFIYEEIGNGCTITFIATHLKQSKVVESLSVIEKQISQ